MASILSFNKAIEKQYFYTLDTGVKGKEKEKLKVKVYLNASHISTVFNPARNFGCQVDLF